MRYCCNLKFAQRPDYDYLRSLFRGCLRRNRLIEDGVFDWTVQRPSKARLAVGADGRPRRPSTVGHDARVQSSDPDEKKEAAAPAARTQSHTGACEERPALFMNLQGW